VGWSGGGGERAAGGSHRLWVGREMEVEEGRRNGRGVIQTRDASFLSFESIVSSFFLFLGKNGESRRRTFCCCLSPHFAFEPLLYSCSYYTSVVMACWSNPSNPNDDETYRTLLCWWLL